MEKQYLLEVESGVITVEVAIAKYAKLAQIQTGFIYDEERIVHELVTPDENPRLNLLKQILEEEVEGKCCVVYHGDRAILPVLETRRLPPTIRRGSKGVMKPDETEEQKARFNNDPNCRIIFLQIDASKVWPCLSSKVSPRGSLQD